MNNPQKKIAFIPVRGGSKSIPLKNIKMFAGKPLLLWVVDELIKSQVEQIIIASDSEEINNVILKQNYTNKVSIYNRDPINSQDTSSTESVMLEYINKHKNTLSDEDLFILVQATSPFTTHKDINSALELLFKEKSQSLLTATLTKRFFWDTSGNSINYDYTNRPRRQDFDGYYQENGAFYINKVKNIIKYKNRLYGKISVFAMEEYTSLEIDEKIDWIIGEELMKHHLSVINTKD